MERIKDINLVKKGDLMHYNGSLVVVTAIDVTQKIVNSTLENGDEYKIRVHDFSDCTFYRILPRYL